MISTNGSGRNLSLAFSLLGASDNRAWLQKFSFNPQFLQLLFIDQNTARFAAIKTADATCSFEFTDQAREPERDASAGTVSATRTR